VTTGVDFSLNSIDSTGFTLLVTAKSRFDPAPVWTTSVTFYYFAIGA
jgi:hypothetical protein